MIACGVAFGDDNAAVLLQAAHAEGQPALPPFVAGVPTNAVARTELGHRPPPTQMVLRKMQSLEHGMTKVPVYSATKAFLHSFTLSLRHQLRAKKNDVIELIPPARNTDLGGKGLHDTAHPVADFMHAVFEQLKQGKTEITFGLSEAMSKAGPDDLRTAFVRMHGAD